MEQSRRLRRRDVLRYTAATAAAVGSLAVAPGALQAAEREHDEILMSGRFAVDIPGAPDASKNIREIAIDELTIDIRETTTGVDLVYRLYGPGAAHWGNASFTSAVTLGASKELKTWFDECAKGRNTRKNITVTLFKKDGAAGRSYTLHECFPTQWSSVSFDTSSTVPAERLVCQVGFIEFKT